MQYVEEALFGVSVPIFSYSIKDQFQYPRKFYLIDNGLYSAASFIQEGDKGRLLENLVFNELNRTQEKVCYWRDKSGYEVDFILPDSLKQKDKPSLIQVCYKLDKEKSKNRELRALRKAAKELNVNQALVITRDQWDVITEDTLTFEVIPYVQWCLNAVPIQ